MKHAEIIAQNILEFMKKTGNDKTLKTIGSESTNVKKGLLGGALHWLEIIRELNRATLSNNKWSASISKILNDVTALK